MMKICNVFEAWKGMIVYEDHSNNITFVGFGQGSNES